MASVERWETKFGTVERQVVEVDANTAQDQQVSGYPKLFGVVALHYRLSTLLATGKPTGQSHTD